MTELEQPICPSCREPLTYPSGDGCANMTKHTDKTMSDDLVKRLRFFGPPIQKEAANRIEELEGQLQSVLDRETSILRYYDVKLDAADAKLAKAVEALQFYRSAVNLRIDCEITHAMQEAHTHAEAFIAKIKGEQP